MKKGFFDEIFNQIIKSEKKVLVFLYFEGFTDSSLSDVWKFVKGYSSSEIISIENFSENIKIIFKTVESVQDFLKSLPVFEGLLYDLFLLDENNIHIGRSLGCYNFLYLLAPMQALIQFWEETMLIFDFEPELRSRIAKIIRSAGEKELKTQPSALKTWNSIIK